MAARESQHYVVDFLSADSRGEALERESPPFQQALKPPPPVALSLRTRESSALALKHIFDQIYSSAESNPNNNNNNFRVHDKNSSDFQAFNRDASNAAPFQGGRNHAIPPGWQVNSFPEVHRSCMPETETSFNKVQSQGFSLHDLALGVPTMSLPLSQTGHLSLQQTSLPHAVARPSPTSRQPTAQLTIFYSGTVNVYDDVPADKANAIMLLAGTGNSLYVKQSSEGNKDYSSAALKSPSPPPLHMGPAATGMGGTTGASAASATSSGKAMGFSVPPASNLINNTLTTTISSPPNPLPAPSLTMEPKPQAAPKRPHSGIELPHARKASLARFLEKRKDRVQVKHQQTEATSQNEEKVETSKEESAPSPKKPYLAGLSSPTIKQ